MRIGSDDQLIIWRRRDEAKRVESFCVPLRSTKARATYDLIHVSTGKIDRDLVAKPSNPSDYCRRDKFVISYDL
jgi:hypothetical protein